MGLRKEVGARGGKSTLILEGHTIGAAVSLYMGAELKVPQTQSRGRRLN